MSTEACSTEKSTRGERPRGWRRHFQRCLVSELSLLGAQHTSEGAMQKVMGSNPIIALGSVLRSVRKTDFADENRLSNGSRRGHRLGSGSSTMKGPGSGLRLMDSLPR